MIEKDPKKKRGLLSPLGERMGLDQTSEINAPRAPKAGILTKEETDSSSEETVGDKLRSRMTGRQGV